MAFVRQVSVPLGHRDGVKLSHSKKLDSAGYQLFLYVLLVSFFCFLIKKKKNIHKNRIHIWLPLWLPDTGLAASLLTSQQLCTQGPMRSSFGFIMPVQDLFNIVLLLVHFSHQEMKMILMKSSAVFSCKIGLVYFPALVSKQNPCQLEIIQLVEK